MDKRENSNKLKLKTVLFPIFVVISIIIGLGLGTTLKSTSSVIATYAIPLGLFFMIYPAMTKVELGDLTRSFKDLKTVSVMIFLNYAIAPFLVAGLGYLFFHFIFYHFGLLTNTVATQALVGVVLLGVAPCIAMVIIWTDLAHGNLGLSVSFVTWNSIIQILTTPMLVFLLASTSVFINPILILKSVLLYLATPLAAGMITRHILYHKTYFSQVLNSLNSVQTLALLFTIIVIFWSEGYGIIEFPALIWMMAIVMLVFYFLLFHIGYFTARSFRYNYRDATAIGFTVSARDFEISIAIAISAFAAYPFVAITTAIGPLLEIPLMLMLVWLQLNRQKKLSIIDNLKTVGEKI